MKKLGHHNSIWEISVDILFGSWEGDAVNHFVYLLKLQFVHRLNIIIIDEEN